MQKLAPLQPKHKKKGVIQHYYNLGQTVWVFGNKMEDDKEHWDLECDAPLRRLSSHLAVISGIPGAGTYPVRPHLPPVWGKDKPLAYANTHFLHPSFVHWGVILIILMQLGAHLIPQNSL